MKNCERLSQRWGLAFEKISWTCLGRLARSFREVGLEPEGQTHTNTCTHTCLINVSSTATTQAWLYNNEIISIKIFSYERWRITWLRTGNRAARKHSFLRMHELCAYFLGVFLGPKMIMVVWSYVRCALSLSYSSWNSQRQSIFVFTSQPSQRVV